MCHTAENDGYYRSNFPTDDWIPPGRSLIDWMRVVFSHLGNNRIVRLFAVVGIYAMPAFLFLRRFGVTDVDIWWHMATGRWILQHHAFPTTEPFSAGGAGRPWIAYSWLFDITTEYLYRWFGFVGIVVYELLFHIVLGIALFHLVKSLLPHFWRSIALTGVCLYVIDYMVTPRPGMLTILLGIVELDILLSVRRTGRARKLWWLRTPFCFVDQLAHPVCIRTDLARRICRRDIAEPDCVGK